MSCRCTLTSWLNGNKTSMPFCVPALWRESSNHFNDCYFCMTDIRGFTKKIKHNIKYPDVPSMSKPVLHREEMPPPLPLSKNEIKTTEESDFQILMNIMTAAKIPSFLLQQVFLALVVHI
ncbi:hypothetical protein WA026_012902 [Henosepilachna vigintioctopunctata]|uniref:Uncharacterized protein n=1 Tax=Henosepilachna vigintioctopunctata TaxID=420089 RepID=A0AAW1TWJ3_9CUCU